MLHDLDHAHATGPIGFKFVIAAKGGDLDSSRLRSLQDGGTFGGLHRLAIDFQRYMFHIDLPLCPGFNLQLGN
jgi:hypothetical protein